MRSSLPGSIGALFALVVAAVAGAAPAQVDSNLAPGGRLAIVEMKPMRGPETRVPAERIVQEMTDAGYVLARQFHSSRPRVS